MGTLAVSSEITLNLLRPNSGQIVYAKQFDKASRKITASILSGESEWLIPDGLEIVVMYSKPDGKCGMYDVIEDDTTKAVTKIGPSKIEIILAEQALSAAGNVFVEIAFFTEQEKLTSLSFVVCVEKGVPDNDTLTSDNYFNVLSQMIQGLLGATIHPPQIDPNTLNWLTWDTTSGGYIDSGVYARGEVGAKGDKGDPGKTPVSFRRVSGSGRPGERDEYTCVLNDGEEVGSLVVYNGQDGEGATGSQVPLKDNGSGSVGIANAYSREDHVHPLNVDDSMIPSPLGTASPGVDDAYSRSDHVHQMPSSAELVALLSNDMLNALKPALLDMFYPIGCTYESSDDTSPAELFGGYWNPIEGRFTIGASSTYPAGSTGGSERVTLSEAQMPAHTHGLMQLSGSVSVRPLSNKTSSAFGAVSGIVTTPRSSGTFSGGLNYTGIDDTKGWDIHVNATHEHASVGGGQSHSNMPPYVAYYKWERVAPPE